MTDAETTALTCEGGGLVFDFFARLGYTMCAKRKDASRLGRARGDDQDGRRILVADIVAQSPLAVKVGGCFCLRRLRATGSPTAMAQVPGISLIEEDVERIE